MPTSATVFFRLICLLSLIGCGKDSQALISAPRDLPSGFIIGGTNTATQSTFYLSDILREELIQAGWDGSFPLAFGRDASHKLVLIPDENLYDSEYDSGLFSIVIFVDKPS